MLMMVGDLGYATELGNSAEYSGAPNEEECATADLDNRKRALLIGGASRMHIYVRRGGPNFQTSLAKMRALGEELKIPLEIYVSYPEEEKVGVKIMKTYTN